MVSSRGGPKHMRRTDRAASERRQRRRRGANRCQAREPRHVCCSVAAHSGDVGSRWITHGHHLSPQITPITANHHLSPQITIYHRESPQKKNKLSFERPIYAFGSPPAFSAFSAKMCILPPNILQCAFRALHYSHGVLDTVRRLLW